MAAMEANAAPARSKKRNKIVSEDGDSSALSISGSQTSFPFDEAPIGKAGPMSFDALLERELARENAAKAIQSAESAGSSASKKGSFLRRGLSCVYMQKIIDSFPLDRSISMPARMEWFLRALQCSVHIQKACRMSPRPLFHLPMHHSSYTCMFFRLVPGSGGGAAFGKAEAEKRRSSLSATSGSNSGSSSSAQRQPFSDRGNQPSASQGDKSAQQDGPGSENDGNYSRTSLPREQGHNTSSSTAQAMVRPSTAPSRHRPSPGNPWDEVPVGGPPKREPDAMARHVASNAWDEVPVGGQAARSMLGKDNLSDRASNQARKSINTSTKLASPSTQAVTDQMNAKATGAGSKPVARRLRIDEPDCDDDDDDGESSDLVHNNMHVGAPNRKASPRAVPHHRSGSPVRDSTLFRIEKEIEEEELREFESLERRVHEEEVQGDGYADGYDDEEEDEEYMQQDGDDDDDDDDDDGQDPEPRHARTAQVRVFVCLCLCVCVFFVCLFVCVCVCACCDSTWMHGIAYENRDCIHVYMYAYVDHVFHQTDKGAMFPVCWP
jgi:hypothetical protein